MSSTDHRASLTAISINFAIRVLNRSDLRSSASEALDETKRWHKRDCPLKPLLIIWLVIGMTFFRTQSIPNVFRRLLFGSGLAETELPSRTVTPEALWRARERLGSLPMKVLFRKMAGGYTPAPSFLGFRLWGYDGTYFTVPDTPANTDEFGKKGSDRGPAAYPQMLGGYLIDLASHMIRDCDYEDCHTSERTILNQLLSHLGPGDLIMVDRGLSSYRLFLQCQERGVAFLGRLPSTWKPKLVRCIGPGDCGVDVEPSQKERLKMEREGLKVPTLRVRLISFRIGQDDEVVRLLTSLVDPIKYPAHELAVGYHKRWECELAYKEMKGYLTAVTHGKQDTTFRSKNPDGCYQEAWGLVLTYNLIRDAMTEAAKTCEPPISPLTLSFVDTVEVLKQAQSALQVATLETLPGLYKQLSLAISECKIDRPRRARSYPRKVKRKMSNFGKKGPGDKQILRNFAVEIRLV